MVTPDSFRTLFPAFADDTVYPDVVINTWIPLAEKFVNPVRWQEVTDLGISLFVAHNLILEQQAEAASAMGNVPGVMQGGVVSSKSVDKVSVSYDTAAGAELNAGHWNLSIYGKRFIRFARMMGAGGVQMGVPTGQGDPLSSSNAWPGPDTYPGWLGS